MKAALVGVGCLLVALVILLVVWHPPRLPPAPARAPLVVAPLRPEENGATDTARSADLLKWQRTTEAFRVLRRARGKPWQTSVQTGLGSTLVTAEDPLSWWAVLTADHPAEGEALERELDLLELARRMQHEADSGMAAARLGAVDAVSPDQRARMLGRPAPLLRRTMAGLNRIAPLAQPLERPILRERDLCMAAFPADWAANWRSVKLGRLGKAYIGGLSVPAIQRRLSGYYDSLIALTANREWKRQSEALRDFREARPWSKNVWALIRREEVNAWLMAVERYLDFDPVVLADGELRFQALRVEVAARLFTLERGHAPAGVEDLVPAYLPAVPEDPYDTGLRLQLREKRCWSPGQGSYPLR